MTARTSAAAIDPRVEAMAREWCRMLALDPDYPIRQPTPWPKTDTEPRTALLPRWVGYIANMQRLLDAADHASTSKAHTDAA
jgi:hypothetical protein